MVSRESEKRLYIRSRGFTLVEMLVVIALATTIIGGITLLMTQFRRSFSKGEETGVTLQEGGMFLALLRNDLVNAVFDKRLSPDRWREAIKITPERLAMTVYTGESDQTTLVEYLYEPGSGKGSISRSAGGSRPRTLVNGRIASLSWELATEEIGGSPTASGTPFLWINLQARFGGQDKAGVKGKELVLSTKLFPARLIRQLR
ncbi:MAG TPA: prepilin-type N-terminal cleavage/methylation domain-containing protein [Candidatus Ozemobacteraceae bacterium]|nr:prepilin-type N-terminal cleavage/methylation domain-containing protein [Candidatus Ozemobacteraceae bacterium]